MSQEPHINQVRYEPIRATRLSLSGFSRDQLFLSGTAGIMLAVYVTAILFGPIVRGNDTSTSFAHLGTWSAALKAGNPLSVWAPADANGFGSPAPFFYHKLFNLVGSALVIATGDIVTGFRLTVLFFSAVMFWGAYQCGQRLGQQRLSRLAMATACVWAPYAIGNIIERCAVAEYAAMALVPLILALALDFYVGDTRKWHTLALLALLVLLALAHVLLFVVVVALLFALSLYLVATARKGGWGLVLGLVMVLAAFTVLIYVPFTYWSTLFCPDQARVFGRPSDHVLALTGVLLSLPGWRVGWPGTAVMIAIAFRLRKGRGQHDQLALGLGVIAILLIGMMTRVATPLWNLSPWFDYFQFPWRLLTIATPMAIVALFGLLEGLDPVTRRRLQLDLLFLAICYQGLTLWGLQWKVVKPQTVPLAELRRQPPSFESGPDAFGEYFPAAFQSRLHAVRSPAWASSVLPAARAFIEASGCSYTDMPRPYYFAALRISAVCMRSGTVRINQFSTPFLDTVAIGDHRETVKPIAHSQFIDFALLPGHWTITVRQRSYIELVEMAWRARLGDRSGE